MGKRVTLKQQVAEQNLIIVAIINILGITHRQIDNKIKELLNPTDSAVDAMCEKGMSVKEDVETKEGICQKS